MRVIKFRAWNPSVGKMTHFPSYVLTGDWEDKTGLFFKAEDGIFLTPYTEPMQFIGFCDCNGKEIYEGDIDITDGVPMVVVFADGAFGLEFPDHTGFENCLRWDRLKVIGNIYENPELLEVPA